LGYGKISLDNKIEIYGFFTDKLNIRKDIHNQLRDKLCDSDTTLKYKCNSHNRICPACGLCDHGVWSSGAYLVTNEQYVCYECGYYEIVRYDYKTNIVEWVNGIDNRLIGELCLDHTNISLPEVDENELDMILNSVII
jgi:hypothetical protein